MISKFMNLELEKRERIINAALKEFAQKGYKNASTNEIVKEANISKGLLFHYFNNKKNLFRFLYDYTVEIFLKEFYDKLEFNETDIIKRWRQIALLKIKLIQNNPELYNFMVASATDDSVNVEIKQEIENKSKAIFEDFSVRLMVNIDTSKFKEGLNIQHVSEIIIWVAQGFGNRELEKLKHSPVYKTKYDLNLIMGEFDGYIELLKGAFYKNN